MATDNPIPLDQTVAAIDYEGRPHPSDCNCETCLPTALLWSHQLLDRGFAPDATLPGPVRKPSKHHTLDTEDYDA